MNNHRLSYFLGSAAAFFDEHRKICPSCGSKIYRQIDSKYFFTCLQRCEKCHLLFRTPTDLATVSENFYQSDYDGGVATDLPGQKKLEVMRKDDFRSFPNSYWPKIDLIEKLGVKKGARVLDYGASWGYGTHQWRVRGYDSVGFEVGRSRAKFGRDNLGVSVVSSLSEIEGKFDVFFSCHVIEHIPKISSVFSLAKKLLNPGGLFIAFTPNGSLERRKKSPVSWSKSWGMVHPLFLDKEFYTHEFSKKPMMLASSPYSNISLWDKSDLITNDLSGDELLIVVQY